MPRVSVGVKRRQKHKKILKETKGFWGTRSKTYRRAKEAFIRAGEHQFAGRKIKKRDLRTTWIQRINASLKPLDINYGKLVNLLNKKGIKIDRKILAELCVKYPKVFKSIVNKTVN